MEVPPKVVLPEVGVPPALDGVILTGDALDIDLTTPLTPADLENLRANLDEFHRSRPNSPLSILEDVAKAKVPRSTSPFF